jgi:hypothetical protein
MDGETSTKVIELAISLYITAYVVGPALHAFATANLTGVPLGVQTLFNTVVPLVATIGIALMFYRGAVA